MKTPVSIRRQLNGDYPGHQEGEEVLGTAGENTVNGGGRYLYVGNVLLVTGVSGYLIQIRVMGHVGGGDEDGVGNPYNLPKVYHR